VFNKSDLSRAEPATPIFTHRGVFHISALSGSGVEELLSAIAATFTSDSSLAGELLITEQRHHDALLRSRDALFRARTLHEPTLMASDLRDAANALGEITGETIGEEILDRIFSQFCIGK